MSGGHLPHPGRVASLASGDPAAARVACWAWSMVAAAVAAIAVWLATAAQGAGTSPDSAAYVSAARSLLAAGALVRFDGTPLVEQPPLYPMVLAAAAAVSGTDPLAAARGVQAALAGLVAALVLATVIRFVTLSPVLLVSTLLVAALGVPLVQVSLMVWTESLFVALTVGALYAGLVIARKPACHGWLVTLGGLAGVSAVTRYAGVFVVAWAVFAALASHGRRVGAGLGRAALVGGIAVLPLAAWAVRNAGLGQPVLGPRDAADATLAQSAGLAVRTLADWALPVHADVAFLTVAAVLALAGLAMAWLPARTPAPSLAPALTRLQWFLLGALPVGYVLFMLALSVRAAFDPLSNRLLVPAFPPLWILVVAGAAAAMRAAGFVRVVARGAATVAVVMASTIAAAATVDGVRALARDDGLGFSSSAWKASELAGAVRGLRYDCALRSNNPEALYLLTGRASQSAPARTPYRSSVRLDEIERWPPSLPTCLVWFTTVSRGYLHDLAEIRARAPAAELVRAADGIVLGVPEDRFPGVSRGSSSPKP